MLDKFISDYSNSDSSSALDDMQKAIQFSDDFEKVSDFLKLLLKMRDVN